MGQVVGQKINDSSLTFMKNTKFFEKVHNNSRIIGFNYNESKLNQYLING